MPPFLAKLAIDDGISEGDLGALTIIVVLFVVAGLANLLASMAQTYFTGWTGERILADLRNKLFRHLQRLSLGFFERNRAGVVISRLTNDVEALDQLVTDGVASLFQNTLMLVGSAVILFVLDWRLALGDARGLPVHGASRRAVFRRRSTRAYRSVRERLGLVTATLAEDIAGMRVVQSFSAGGDQPARVPLGEQPLPRLEPGDGRPQRPLLPVRRLPLGRGDSASCSGSAAGSTLEGAGHGRHALRLPAVPLELLRPDPAALAALQHVPRPPWRRSTRSWT